MKGRDEKLEFLLIKLVVAMQTTIELFDEFKETKIYRHDLKMGTNNLCRKFEDKLKDIYKHIEDDEEKEETFMAIQRSINKILDSTLQELYEEGYEPIK
jgi:signal recognition particle GTPase|tara:strand:- start:273 stop:569 length:297 start_codon:yes stop_codon:yes gene_type:complete